MSKTVTVRRGETLPENMVGEPLVVRGTPVYPRYELKPGDEIPLNALEDSYTVEVHDDPPQAYLIVPCEKGKGTHWNGKDGNLHYGFGERCDCKQIPCALTLEDLRLIRGHLAETGPKISLVTFELFGRLTATLAAWAAVPQAKEAGK